MFLVKATQPVDLEARIHFQACDTKPSLPSCHSHTGNLTPCICFVAGPCLMDPMEGECQDYILKWYYNMDKRACQQFWYGGCGGNANRFETKEECEVRCVPTPL